MDLATLLAARLEAERAAPPVDTVTGDERALLAALDPEAGPTAAWIAAAVRVIAEHQRSARAEQVWPLLRVIEPLLPSLEERDPASAGRVHGALAAQALLEVAPETFLDREARAVEAFDRAGDARLASVERAALGAAWTALGVAEEADRALSAALLVAEREGLVLTASSAQHHLARLHARRDIDAAAGSLAQTAATGFASRGAHHQEGVVRASHAMTLVRLQVGGLAELEARRALEALAGSPERALAAAALARALLAQGKASDAVAALDGAAQDALDVGWLAGGGAPVWIALADAHHAAGDSEASAAALAEARRRVLAAASKLTSPALRRSYLERIPEHRRALGLDAPPAT